MLISNSKDRSEEKPRNEMNSARHLHSKIYDHQGNVLEQEETAERMKRGMTKQWHDYFTSLLMPCLSTGAYRLSMINIFPLPNYKFDRRRIPWRSIFYAGEGD